MVIEALVATPRSWQLAPRGAARGQWSARHAVVIAVAGRDGEIGLGEAAPLPGMSRDTLADATTSCAAFATRLPIRIESPTEVNDVVADVSSHAARFALEAALLTSLAQRGHTSVAQLLVAKPQADVVRAIVVDSETDSRLAAARCVKIKLGRTPTADDLVRVARIAHACPSARLRFDANRGWTSTVVRASLHQLAVALGPDAQRVDYVEEPCPQAHELLSEPLPLPIALDESLIDLHRSTLAVALASGRLAALVLKPTLLGGFARCLALAALARAHGVAAIASHALEGAVGRAACGQLARALGAAHAHGVDA
jgi:O-succinylbenzoate synthase